MVQCSKVVVVINTALRFLSLEGIRKNRSLQRTNHMVASFRVPDQAFPARATTILGLVMAAHSFAFVSLFPYVGIMVTELLDLETTNKAGECWRHEIA